MPGRVQRQDSINTLVDVLAGRAILAAGGPRAYFFNLIQKTDLPQAWKMDRLGALIGAPQIDARNLVSWAFNQGGNIQDPRYHTLGSLLKGVLPELGLEHGRFVTAFILSNKLYRDPALQRELQAAWRVPAVEEAGAFDAALEAGSGPDFTWEGGEVEAELQAFGRPPPDMLDIGFLQRAILRSAGVCRLEYEHMDRVGTAFLVAPDLALTNYHNLNLAGDEDMQANAAQLKLRFGVVTTAAGGEAEGRTFSLAGERIVASSPVNELDYALLRVEEAVTFLQDAANPVLAPLPLSGRLPAEGEGLNILQHPGGEALKLAISADGIDRVLQGRGLVQYSTRARGGSSGSPAFDDDWQVVALHHAERSRAFGAVREGILMHAILEEVGGFL